MCTCIVIETNKHHHDNRGDNGRGTDLGDEPAGEEAKDDGVASLLVVIWDSDLCQLPEFLTPVIETVVG